ncbi:MAG TPA: Glu/Leu/Phe/Val dehydrogenase dimerization domain-containing protein [Melioribacteraceae bacterium]|nr:Glu/Leu/Phe/Val dehydrogenase dimerization domain-containing protein [Melioribacteraceae bacterium]
MTNVLDFLKQEPAKFIAFLKENKIKKFYFVTDEKTNKVVSSHDELKPIAEYINADKRDYLKHEGMFFELSEKYDSLYGAFVHKTNRGQAAGGLRYWKYFTLEDFLRDGLRLSAGMTRKNSLAGLWWGGGKGIIIHNPEVDFYDKDIRKYLYQDYGRFVTTLQGCYITAEDVGSNTEDMANVHLTTRFVTCIPPEVGGSGNPSEPTARGVISGMEAALNFLGTDFKDKTIVVQGMGNVGAPVIKYAFEKGAKKIIAGDINVNTIQKVINNLPGKNLETRLTEIGDNSILLEECDVVAPCATGAILKPEIIENLKAKIVCGAANNQLEDSDRDDVLLQKRGIVYVPDFLTNRMGIVNCANEQYGYVNNDPLFEQQLNKDWEYSVYQTTLRVLNASKETGMPPAKKAIELADELAEVNHPIFGHRGQLIINTLVENKWHLK